MAVMGVMGCIGSCFYLQIVGIADKKHSYMIFGVISIIDVVMLSFLLLMIKIGKFGAPAYDMDGGSDKSQSRGADEGEGGYADIPQLPEVFDEKILEANEEHEVSTIRRETIKDDVDLMISSRRSDYIDLKVGSINNKLGSSGDGEDCQLNEPRNKSNLSKSRRSSQIDSLKPDDEY